MVAIDRYQPLTGELEEFYDSFDPKCGQMKQTLDAMYEVYRDAHPEVQKTEQLRTLVQNSNVHIFRHYPFWFQFDGGRPRKIWGGLDCPSGGAFLYNVKGGAMADTYGKYFENDRWEGFIHNWNNPVGHDHHALNYDDILKLGLSGLRARAEAYRASCTDPDKLPFYNAAVESLGILRELSLRFSAEAARLAAQAQDKADRAYYSHIADSAARVPENPPETFYEALAAIVFCREAVGTLEGIGISTYGHLDRMLYPYYERDLEAGRITENEALDLFCSLLYYTAVRFEENTNPRETSTTIVLGGCDMDGNVVYNAVTDLILRAELITRTANVKFDCRVSKAHPKAYFDRMIEIQLSGLPVLVLMNDETHIAARVKHGQDVRDARLYVAGGCHEIVLGGTEVCTRADTWIGLPRILLETLRRGNYADFDSLYTAAIADVKAYHEKVVAAKNEVEQHWAKFNPLPLYSTMLTGCVESGRDAAAGGSKYASTALSMVAPATFIDSLWAVKVLCFDEGRVTVPALVEILDKDFEGNEPLRQYIINRIPKHCTGDETLDAFSAKVLHDLSGVSGQTNGRGGRYYPAFYAHEIFRPLGERTSATPDGRKAGYPLSRGLSPSEFLTGITPLHMLHSTARLDLTEFTDSFALEMTLPKLDGERGQTVLASIVRQFLEAGGSTLQFNLLDAAALRDAQVHPDQHRDLLVRVCGYSFYFVKLSRTQQNEVIARAARI